MSEDGIIDLQWLALQLVCVNYFPPFSTWPRQDVRTLYAFGKKWNDFLKLIKLPRIHLSDEEFRGAEIVTLL